MCMSPHAVAVVLPAFTLQRHKAARPPNQRAERGVPTPKPAGLGCTVLPGRCRVEPGAERTARGLLSSMEAATAQTGLVQVRPVHPARN